MKYTFIDTLAYCVAIIFHYLHILYFITHTQWIYQIENYSFTISFVKNIYIYIS